MILLNEMNQKYIIMGSGHCVIDNTHNQWGRVTNEVKMNRLHRARVTARSTVKQNLIDPTLIKKVQRGSLCSWNKGGCTLPNRRWTYVKHTTTAVNLEPSWRPQNAIFWWTLSDSVLNAILNLTRRCLAFTVTPLAARFSCSIHIMSASLLSV